MISQPTWELLSYYCPSVPSLVLKILLKAYILWIAYCWMNLECNRHLLHLFLKCYNQFIWSYGWCSFFFLCWKKWVVPKLQKHRFEIKCCWHVHRFFWVFLYFGHKSTWMSRNLISASSKVSWTLLWNMELLHLEVGAFYYMENLFNPLMVSLFQANE